MEQLDNTVLLRHPAAAAARKLNVEAISADRRLVNVGRLQEINHESLCRDVYV
jgi:hypothetical protein